MQVTKEQIDPCTVSLDFEIEPETVKKAFDRAYREFSAFTNVPGFRPGKAPRPMLERYVNQERLQDRVKELVAAPAYSDAIKNEEITPYSDPEVEFSDLAQDKPWHFKAVVPMPPAVVLGDYKTISVERPVFGVADEDVESTIRGMREEYARLEKVEGRGVESEDVIIAETQIGLDGKDPEEEPQRKLIRLGNNIPGFDEAVLGMKEEEERTFELTYPEDYQDADAAGKKGAFHVKLLSINQRVVPDLTDDWVKQATGFTTVSELKDDVSEGLQQRLKQSSDQVAEARIVEEIVKRSKIAFPRILVQEEMRSAAEDLSQELQRSHVSYEQFLQATNQTEEQHHSKLEADAVSRVKVILVLREVAKNEKMTATGDEIDREFTKYLDDSEVSERERRKIVDDRGKRVRVANVLVREKLRDFLLNTAKITDVKPKKEKAGKSN